jgi:hypothetical protein
MHGVHILVFLCIAGMTEDFWEWKFVNKTYDTTVKHYSCCYYKYLYRLWGKMTSFEHHADIKALQNYNSFAKITIVSFQWQKNMI